MHAPCLIVVDLLNDFLDRWKAERRRKLIVHTNQLIEGFRKSDRPVIWIRQEFRSDLNDAFLEMRDKQRFITIEGTRGAQIDSDLDCQASDSVVVKKRYSAFFGTNLDALLNELGITEFVLAGINTHACIRMAAIDAYQRDLRVVLASECIDSYNDEHARISLDYMDGKIASIMTNAQIFNALTQGST